MSAPVFSVGDQGSELEQAEPKQRADSSSVLRSEVSSVTSCRCEV
jgi:hypothetical protein